MPSQVHGETGHADTAPDRLAAKYGLHPRSDVQDCMDHLARNRATACVQALAARGIAAARLTSSYRARTGNLKVEFKPLPMEQVRQAPTEEDPPATPEPDPRSGASSPSPSEPRLQP